MDHLKMPGRNLILADVAIFTTSREATRQAQLASQLARNEGARGSASHPAQHVEPWISWIPWL